jgi:signal transduction histidine kinase
MHLELLSGRTKNTEVKKSVNEIRSLVDDTMIGFRGIITDLIPDGINSNDISSSLRLLIGKYSNLKVPVVSFYCNENISLKSKKDELHVYRIVQEFVHNSIKHASATSIQVFMEELHGKVELRLCDDGLGFDVESQKHTGGILNMQVRLDEIRSNYSFCSFPYKGVTLTISI